MLPRMADFDISGWVPHWMTARDQLNLQRTDLLGLRGQRIVDSWLVCDLEHDSWFADLPVILAFDNGRHLEVSWQKFDELSVTWNTIDVLIEHQAWVEWPLTWRSQGHESLISVAGTVVQEVASSEHRFTTGQLSPTPRSGAETSSTWLTGGIWFGTDGAGLHIFNALDETGLTNDPVVIGEDNRVMLL